MKARVMRNTKGEINGRQLLQGIVWELSKLKIFLDAGLNRHFDINDSFTSEKYIPLEELGIQLFRGRYYRHFEELVSSIEGNNNIRDVILRIKKLIYFYNESRSFVVKNIYRDGRPVGSLVVKTEGVNQWISENITNVLSEQIPKLEKLLEIFPAGAEGSPAGAEGRTELPFKDQPDSLKIPRDRFEEIERWLIDQKYIDYDGVWIKPKKELAALLQFLIDNNVFQPKAKRTKIRDSFVLRYKVEKINDQFIPSKIKMNEKKVFNGLSFIINPVSR